jgi:hypothetical protein
LSEFVARHALERAGVEGNVRLRPVSKEAWRFLEGRQAAPMAAVALDLAEERDPRSARSGRKALRALDRQWRNRRAP